MLRLKKTQSQLDELGVGDYFSSESSDSSKTKNPSKAKDKKKEIYDPNSIKFAQQMVADFRKDWEEAATDVKPYIEAALNYWEEELKRRQKRKPKLEVDLEINTEATSALKGLPEKIEPLKEIEADSLSATDAINGLGSAFSSLGNAIGGTGGQIVSFAGQVVSSGAEMMAQMSQIIAANQAAALAKGISSASGLMFPYNLAAIATVVATIGSLFASLPKFETGGIVPGASTIGDKTLIRANAGEMILNPRQQDNLFKAIDNNRLGSPQISGDVRFVIDGDKLVGVFNNYNSKMKRQG